MNNIGIMMTLENIKDLIAAKDFETAKVELKSLIEAEANNFEHKKLLGLVHINLEQMAEAKKNFEDVVKFCPEDATSWFYLANCYNSLADFISAKNAYKKVIELRPEYVEAHKSLCVILLKLNEIDETVKYANLGRDVDSEDYIYDFIIGTAYMKNKDFSKALAPLVSAYEKAPEIIGTINSLGTCYMAMNKIDEAIETYEKALELSPNNSMTYYNIGSAYQILQNHEKACEYIQKALEIEEEETFLSSLAMSEVKLQKYEEALKHYKQLALMCPGKESTTL